jgi:hypothetical protein
MVRRESCGEGKKCGEGKRCGEGRGRGEGKELRPGKRALDRGERCGEGCELWRPGRAAVRAESFRWPAEL